MYVAKKFEVGTSVVINDKIWKIFDHRTKFGVVTGYTLKRLNSTGENVSMFLEEEDLESIISSSKYIIEEPLDLK
tara:strand:+ start:2362 stop:2586 length:225 start_codon:yes stop_codon:yes gene_type:complete